MSQPVQAGSRIFVAGHRGLVGSAIVRQLRARGFENLIVRTHAEVDLTDAAQVAALFAEERPEYVILAAAKMGGILANTTYPADFLRLNLAIECAVIEASYQCGVERLLFLGSSAVYPRECAQPMREEMLYTGPLEPTNRPYALAKLAGVELCAAYNRQHGTGYLCVLPANLYGPGDNYDAQNSTVLAALIRKVAVAKAAGRREIDVWGSGMARRELLYSEDMAGACIFLLELTEERYGTALTAREWPMLNAGVDVDYSIREIAETVCHVAELEAELVFDTTKPDGVMRKLLDSSALRGLGWSPRVGLEEGIALAYAAAKPLLGVE